MTLRGCAGRPLLAAPRRGHGPGGLTDPPGARCLMARLISVSSCIHVRLTQLVWQQLVFHKVTTGLK